MRLAVITNLYPPHVMGGYEIGCSQTVAYFRDQGYDVKVLTAALPDIRPEEHVFPMLDLSWHMVPGGYTGVHPRTRDFDVIKGRVLNPTNARIVGKLVEQWNVDACLLYNLEGIGGVGIILTLNMLGIPCFFIVNDNVPTRITDLGNAVKTVALRTLYNRLADVFYVSKTRHLIEEISSQGIEVDNRHAVIAGWRYATAMTSSSEIAHYVPGEELRICACSLFAEHKGSRICLDIVQKLLDRGITKFRIDWYGKIEDNLAANDIWIRKLDKHLNLKGPVPPVELAGVLRDYHLNLFPTWKREPFGIAPLDAAAHGALPLITDGCGVAEWLENDRDCIKLPRDANAFTNAIHRIHDGTIDIAMIRQGLPERIATFFSIERYMDGLVVHLNASKRSQGRSAASAARISDYWFLKMMGALFTE